MKPLSFSSISLYEECSQKFKFRYIDHLPEKPRHYFSFGKSVHTALEYFYSTTPPPSLPEVLQHFQAKWFSEGYKDAQQESDYFTKGQHILTNFYTDHATNFKPPFFTEYRFDLQVDGVAVIGYIDRIDRVADGRVAIIDYKTGSTFSKDRVNTDDQLTMYQLACEELLGMKVDSLTFYHLNSSTPYTSNPRTSEQVLQLRAKIVSVANSISQGIFLPSPEDRKCSWCDYKPYCPAFQNDFISLKKIT